MIRDIIKRIFKIETAYGHCDVPCGIYDPHLSVVSAHTVVRMVDLMNALDKNDSDYDLKMSRYISVKEEHGELAKHEIRILWGDYFKPEHTQTFSELNSLVWDAMRQGSAGRQTASIEKAKEFLETVLKIAEIFWKTKGKTPRRVAAPYPSGGEIILPE
ncbi:MAG: superoxide dismutase, Ni [Candidatus Kariarchaeaceae archaeon]|jgi:nickel superoxide dismutase